MDFWFPIAYESYVYTIMYYSIQCVGTLCLRKKVHVLSKKHVFAENANHHLSFEQVVITSHRSQ